MLLMSLSPRVPGKELSPSHLLKDVSTSRAQCCYPSQAVLMSYETCVLRAPPLHPMKVSE